MQYLSRRESSRVTFSSIVGAAKRLRRVSSVGSHYPVSVVPHGAYSSARQIKYCFAVYSPDNPHPSPRRVWKRCDSEKFARRSSRDSNLMPLQILFHTHFSFSYSFFASIRIGTSGSAFFQSAKKS